MCPVEQPKPADRWHTMIPIVIHDLTRTNNRSKCICVVTMNKWLGQAESMNSVDDKLLKNMKITLAFDVYGTLVDPSGMAEHLTQDLGAKAAEFADYWREKQLEYSFRRGLMHNYADFSILTSHALNFTCRRFKTAISSERQSELLILYQHLPRFNDVTPALYLLRGAFRLFAFSNGKRSEVTAVLSNANILDYFEGIVTADDVRSFKPDPAVYSYARRATRAWSSPFWLGSSNPWDIIGARSAGLSSAWVQRSDEKIYDPWNIEQMLP
jgi:2-haloacid dehalogenase